MKNTKKILLIAIVAILSSCANTKKFPVSNIVPAADISVKKNINSQKNFTLEITVQNLASPERINPPGKNYIVWIVTKDFGIKNVGQLNVENAKKGYFNTITPFDFYEVFITVENQGDLNYPKGAEIARVRL